jgi:nuclear transport factor 2 (NTF2) superfamily protein
MAWRLRPVVSFLWQGENWEFNDQGFMRHRFASIHDHSIKNTTRKIF